ncbi:lytic transglycosylase domain-containing protein [Phenylobacterium kunshanense]|uniref:Lytic transglycosylase domain-containing protein n=2 Tax=Phenylobacterium kunshanense TaxID=1445034 RepID=A0A328BW24_9CAUL|nr:lytic transglycosylase domain-containing protein [Phenylobacterium kunshanense]
MARAQSADPIGDLLSPKRAEPATAPAAPARQTVAQPLGAADQASLKDGLNAARRADVAGARAAISRTSHPIARKLVTWALVDANAEALSFYEVDAARRDLAGFPRPGRRQAAAEKLIETSGKSPGEIVEWFGGQAPQSAHGALALATAYRATGRQAEAADLIRAWWRGRSFEADVQSRMLSRFGDVLTTDDHARRADVLLYGSQGPAARAVVALLPTELQATALARISLRGDSEANYNALSPADQASPGVAFERAAYLRRKGRESEAVAQLANFPKEMVTSDGAERMWSERKRLVATAIRANDWRGAYQAAANSGLNEGVDATEAEFYAGWMALNRLNDPVAAGRHFANIARIGTSPITRGRAFYWQGRAAEARGDKPAAEAFYAQGAEHLTTFYGQLSAEKLGRRLTLVSDPTPSAADRARFEGQDVVQAMRMLADQGQRDLFRAFALHIDDNVPTTVDAALLIDAIRDYGDQDTSMKAARAAATRGLILTDRAYPYRTPPDVAGAPEPALVLGITRQESGFDPSVRSHADARGMMQLLPSTAQVVARRMGVSYSVSQLYEPDYNMRLGSSFLGQLVDRFSGSYILAAAGYNAGPGRPAQWVSWCGDPRAGGQDPLDFIECIPFSETRNYVMRVMENMQVYRAKLNGGSAPITLSQDLKRGGYSYAVTGQSANASAN